uniref:Conotoxin n=1 Tax=Conus betulinus TaxID=89764 RepID=S4UJY9_CONBE|nr:T superfamily conotoxin Bt5.4 precursor [Conus betulinus]AMP44753.1 conotoxin [Conus betulinus]
MLCLPVFIILLLLVSPAATLPVTSKLHGLLTRRSLKNFWKRNLYLRDEDWVDCCHMPRCCVED